MDFTNRIKSSCCVTDGSQWFAFLDIKWCRNWVTVYRRDKLDIFTGCVIEYAYSDWWVDLDWSAEDCPPPVLVKDPEIVCMTNDGGETVVKWVVIFNYDWTTWTSTINNLDGSVATGYTVIPCATANQVEEWEVRCDGGVNIVPFYDVETDWAASANVAFWFNPVTNSVVTPSGNQTPWACAVTKIAQVPNCSWGLDDKSVDSITATYLLNQENKHTEVVSDVLTAVFGWTVAFTYTAPTSVSVSYLWVTLSNDSIVSYRTDFGDGYNDVWPSPSHSYNTDWEYEIKWYAITLSGNKLLLYAKEVTIASGVITYSGTNPHVVARTYKVLVAKAFQDYCGATLVGTPYDANGGVYTIVGDFEVATPIIIDELEDNADYKASVTLPSLNILSWWASIANWTFAATLWPDGTIRNNPWNLKSVTIRARRSNGIDAFPWSWANQVLIQTTDIKLVLLTNESVTYSVEDGNIQDLIYVDTLWNAAALITYNRI